MLVLLALVALVLGAVRPAPASVQHCAFLEFTAAPEMWGPYWEAPETGARVLALSCAAFSAGTAEIDVVNATTGQPFTPAPLLCTRAKTRVKVPSARRALADGERVALAVRSLTVVDDAPVSLLVCFLTLAS